MIFGDSNIDQVIADIDRWVDLFSFDLPGDQGSLGRDIAFEVVEGIQTRSHDEKRGAGAEWNPNEPKYAEWKAKRYKLQDQEPNVRTGQMLSQASLYGATTIEPELITMRYGTGQRPTRTSTGVPLPTHKKGKHAGEQIDDLTDVEKAYFAHTGQGPGGVLRPFYEVDDEISGKVTNMIEKALNKHIGDYND